MARQITRDELALLIEELDRGEAQREELEEIVVDLELAVSDAAAIDMLEDEDMTAKEVADQLMGYSEQDL